MHLSLYKLQNLFDGALRGAESSDLLLNNINGNNHLSNRQRLQIYIDSIETARLKVLSDTFSACCRLVGEEFFRAVARTYLNNMPHPQPHHINYIANDFPDFLKTIKEITENMSFLIDLAHFELAREQAYFSEDILPFDFAPLGEIQAEDYDKLYFKLAPSVKLFDSPYPLMKLWAAGQADFPQDETVILDGVGAKIIVWRDGMDVCECVLTDNEYSFLMGCEQLLDLESISDRMADSMQLAVILPKSIALGWIAEFRF